MLNWGLVGCGDIANKRVAPAIKSQADSILLAVMSPDKEELEGFKSKHNIPEGYLSLEDMLANSSINAIYVATPIFLHYEIALKALKAGKHVLVEKPMAMDEEECEALICEAEKQKVKLGVAYYRRFFPKMAEIKRLISEGVIGDVIAARIVFHSWYNPAKDDPKYWRVVKKKGGGGPLWDMGCHKLDMLVELLGMPRSVSALMSTQTHDYEVEDSCSLLMELQNGAHCSASFYWNSKVWSDEFIILGTNGKITLNPCDGDSIELELTPSRMKGMGKEVTTVMKFNAANVHAPLVDDFAKAVLEGREPKISGSEGYKTNRILAAIEKSSLTGTKIIL
jgi:predicted dehydrogenase